MRTSLFLGVLSAAGVALGFAAQAGVEPTDFIALAVVVVVLFLGVTTFVRLVQLQREAVVYIAGQNRIRHFFVESARSLAEIQGAVRPLSSTPADELGAPF